jgi:hypothetical protein
MSAEALLLVAVLNCPYLWEWASPQCDDGNVYNGYWWHGEWIPGYPSIATWMAPGPYWFSGAAVHYDPGVMEATAHQNGLSLDGMLGGISIPNCGDLGRVAWIDPGTGWEGPYVVVDCSRLGDVYGVVVVRGVAVEVDYPTAQRWNMSGRLEAVRVWFPDAPREFRTVGYREWWLEHLRFAPAWESRPIWKDGLWWAWQPYVCTGEDLMP